jgi:hypothetical protein
MRITKIFKGGNIMRSITASFLSAITAIAIFFQCLFGIGCLGFGKIALQLEKDTYPVGTETIEAVLYNCTGKPIPVGPYGYSLERLESGGWTRIAWKDSVIIPVGMFLLPPFQGVSKSFHLTDYDDLPAGRYRLQASGSAYAEFQLLAASEVSLVPEWRRYSQNEEVRAMWYNSTEDTIWIGPPYEIEQWDGGQWVRVEPREPLGFPDVVFTLKPHQDWPMSYELSYYDLHSGRCRIAAKYGVYGGEGGMRTVYAEFELGGDIGEVALTLKKDTYPVGTETIEATLYNGTDRTIVVAPYYYSLERLEADGWTHVAWKESVFIPVGMFLLQPFRSAGISFHLTDYDDLPAGRYRLTASGSVYAEFDLV